MNKKTKQTVVINGRIFDAHSGLAVKTPAPVKTEVISQKVARRTAVINDVTPPKTSSATTPPPSADLHAAPVVHQERPAVNRNTVTARAVHESTQRSTTLRRQHLKKPLSRRPASAARVHRAVERSHRITRFAPPVTTKKSSHPDIDRELARQAQIIQAAHTQHVAAKAQAAHKPHISSKAVKEHLLRAQLNAAPDTPLQEVYQAGKLSRRGRWMSVASTSLALVLLGGYLTYINIPNLSIRVAAANAGINANLPQYQPGGYRLHGPIAYSPGEVEIKYHQNGGSQGYSITQKASDWDPQATLDNYVQPDSNNDYEIHSIQGLTVYKYDKKAVWVNGGILHIIDGNAPLSGQQVERIAASM